MLLLIINMLQTQNPQKLIYDTPSKTFELI